MIQRILIEENNITTLASRYCYFNTDSNKSFGEYNLAEEFVDGFAIVGRGNGLAGYRFGVVDENGNEVIPLIYHWIYQDTESKVFICTYYHDRSVRTYCGDFLVRLNGKIVTITSQKYILINDFSDHRAAVCICVGNNLPEWGFIDEKGNEIIPCQYTFLRSFSDGFAFVNYFMDDYVISINGEKVFDTVKGYIYGSFHEGRCVFRTGELSGFIDKKGEIIVPAIYHKVTDYHKGIAFVQRNVTSYPVPMSRDGHLLWENQNGCLKLPNKYKWYERLSEDTYNSVNDTFVLVYTEDNRVGVFSYEQKEVIPCKYESIIFSHNALEAKLITTSSHIENGDIVRYFIHGRQLKRQFPPGYGLIVNRFGYDVCLPFIDGIAFVRQNNLWGLILSDGKLLVDKWFQDIIRHETIFYVKYNDYWGILSRTGEILVDPSYEAVDDLVRALETRKQFDGRDIIIPYNVGGIYGFIDIMGKFLVKPVFNWVKKINNNPDDIRYVCYEESTPNILWMVSRKGELFPCSHFFIGFEQKKKLDWVFIKYYDYDYGRLLIKCNGKYGFDNCVIDSKGEPYAIEKEPDYFSRAHQYIYDKIEENDDKTFTVWENNLCLIIDIEGNIISSVD